MREYHEDIIYIINNFIWLIFYRGILCQVDYNKFIFYMIYCSDN